MAVYCNACGTQHTEGTRSCIACGAQLGAGQAPAPWAPPQVPTMGTPAPLYGPPGGVSPLPLADVGTRFMAAMIDGFIVMAGSLPGLAVIGLGIAMTGRHAREPHPLVILGALAIWAGIFAVNLYEVYLLGRDGATLAKRWLGLKVLDAQLQPLGFLKAFAREFVKGLVGQMCAFLFLWPLWDPERRGLHDLALGTKVYKV